MAYPKRLYGLACNAFLTVAALACLATPITATHQAIPTAVPDQGNWDKPLVVYAKADTDTSGPYLSTDSGSSSAERYVVTTDRATGTQQRLAALQRTGDPPSTTFDLRGKLPQTYWLNLSKPIVGSLYYTNGLSQTTGTAGRGLESGIVRFEILSGGQRIGGGEFDYSAAMTANTAGVPWQVLNFAVRPEVTALAPESVLSLKVTRITGVADFAIGTAGTHASRIEFRYFDRDPLGGILYLERGKLIASTTGSQLSGASLSTDEVDAFLERAQEIVREPSEESGPFFLRVETPTAIHDPSTPMVLGAVAPLAFSRRSRQISFALALVLAAAVSGCLGSKGGDPSGQQGTDGPNPSDEFIAITTAPDASASAGNGSVQGHVHEDSPAKLPLKGAHVAILDSNHFQITDSLGFFRMPNVSVGQHRIHVNMQGFESSEYPIEVLEGKRTEVVIPLKALYDPTANRKPHAHGEWPASGQYVLYEDTFTPLGDGKNDPRGSTSYDVGGSWYCPAGGRGAYYLHRSHYCLVKVPVPLDRVVHSGAGRIQVNVTWTPGAHGPQELGLKMYTANPVYEYPFYGWGQTGFGLGPMNDPFVPRGPGQGFNVPFFPNHADPGHMKMSRWSFHLTTPFTDLVDPSAMPLQELGPLTVKITVFKGVIPFEPPHPDFWGNLTQKWLTPEALWIGCSGVGSLSAENLEYPNKNCKTYANPEVAVGPTNPMFVPPGTLAIYGNLTWTGGYVNYVGGYTTAPNPPGSWWGLAYKPANAKKYHENEVFLPAETLAHEDGRMQFRIMVKANEVDQFYQLGGQWAFYPDDRDDPLTKAQGAHAANFILNATIVKDPTFVD